jgi:hypothetical protein
MTNIARDDGGKKNPAPRSFQGARMIPFNWPIWVVKFRSTKVRCFHKANRLRGRRSPGRLLYHRRAPGRYRAYAHKYD